MNRQAVFEKIVAAMNKQGRRSLSLRGRACAYLDSTGAACAIGCLLPVSVINPNDNHVRVSALIGPNSPWRGILGVESELDVQFLIDAQGTLHDNPVSWTDGAGILGTLTESAVRGFAHTWNLSMPPGYT